VKTDVVSGSSQKRCSILGSREKLYLAVEKEVVLSNLAVPRDVSRKKNLFGSEKRCCVIVFGSGVVFCSGTKG